MRTRTICIIVLLAASAGPCLADDLVLTRSAQSGAASPIAYERSWDAACVAMPAQLTITAPPSHGAISVVSSTSVIPATTPRGGSTGQCAGRTITGSQILYRSQPGYRGPDHVAWSVAYGRARGGRTDVTINVE